MTLLAALVLAQVALSDEGGPEKVVRHLDFAGAGVTCSASSTFGTCTIPGGGGGAPAACSAGQAVTSTGAALVCTATLTASDVVCAGTCVADAEIAAVAGAKVSGAVASATLAATATALAADPADCSAGQYATTIAASGALTCAQVTTAQLSGTVTDAQLASNYSGVGACGANTWASTLNDNAAPTCTQPAFSNISGSVTDAQVPNTITIDLATAASALSSNPVACGANLFVTDTAADGTLTCTQPAFSNLSGSATDSQIPDNITVSLAATATALAADPADCSAGQYATTIAASGALTCAQVATSQLSGTVTDSQIAAVATTKLTGTITMAQLGTTNTSGDATTFLRGDGVWVQYPAKTLTSVIAARTNPFLPTCNSVRRCNCRTSKGLGQ